jgi:hypothetical protein
MQPQPVDKVGQRVAHDVVEQHHHHQVSQMDVAEWANQSQ